MPSTNIVTELSEWATTQRNLTIITSIIVAVPVASAFHLMTGSSSQAGGFLLLMTLAVGVPSAYDEYWPQYDRTWKAIAWVLIAATVVTVEFVSFYFLGSDVLKLSAFYAAVGAFLVTDLGNLAWLIVRQNQ